MASTRQVDLQLEVIVKFRLGWFGMDPALLRDLHARTAAIVGSWWQDDRRRWCAYCGIPMRKRCPQGKPQPATLATRDHVIPKAHKGGGLVTIPACRGCNQAKGSLSLPEFLGSEAFLEIRRHKRRHQWSVHDLWITVGLAALRKATLLGAEGATTGAMTSQNSALSPPVPERLDSAR
ncbi:HNH endonuclease [Aurantimonas sp. VKM B-3413]|uniref:HNH endonuclease n=1 Tax=Aurantimonas sp. VKM B-3413 TaxID=2779401 RepID=UPI001E3E88FD|nr:HNH endonuclease [Aurantimonas sp. VKM B-3413]MCB8837895.1 HNH endonuclease [Aurantimonas sp. VKM B-3413]